MADPECPDCGGYVRKVPFGTMDDKASIARASRTMSSPHGAILLAAITGGSALAKMAMSNVFHCDKCNKDYRLWFNKISLP